MSDQIEVWGSSGQETVVVHSHVDAPCTRCGAMDLHEVDDCAAWTKYRYLIEWWDRLAAGTEGDR